MFRQQIEHDDFYSSSTRARVPFSRSTGCRNGNCTPVDEDITLSTRNSERPSAIICRRLHAIREQAYESATRTVTRPPKRRTGDRWTRYKHECHDDCTRNGTRVPNISPDASQIRRSRFTVRFFVRRTGYVQRTTGRRATIFENFV